MADVNMTVELTEAGNGFAALLTAITPALIGFLLSMAIVGGIIALWKALNNRIKGNL